MKYLHLICTPSRGQSKIITIFRQQRPLLAQTIDKRGSEKISKPRLSIV